MCEVCAIFAVGEHWTDSGRPLHAMYPARDIQRYREERRYRVALANRVLAACGVSCEDWDSEAFVVLDTKGRQKVVPTIAEVWPQARSFAGRTIDPLDPEFLRSLTQDG